MYLDKTIENIKSTLQEAEDCGFDKLRTIESSSLLNRAIDLMGSALECLELADEVEKDFSEGQAALDRLVEGTGSSEDLETVLNQMSPIAHKE